MTRSEAVAFVARARSEGKTIVFTNGVFDILHPGHVRYLKEARSLGDVLIVVGVFVAAWSRTQRIGRTTKAEATTS